MHRNARTTSGPVTQISPVTGESLPRRQCRRRTPRAWYEARRSYPLEHYLLGLRPDQPAVQETRIRVPKPRHNPMTGGPAPPRSAQSTPNGHH
jgi:hypothetical protein